MEDEISEKTVPDFNDPDEIRAFEISAEKKDKISGLALSGGGIRSASFALGIVQGFLYFNNVKSDKKLGSKKRSKLGDWFNYLSTVSGGGYLGAALTWLQKNGLDLHEQLDGTFGVCNRSKHSNYQSNNWLDYVRQHGNYLRPDSVSFLSIASVVARNLAVSLAVYFGALVLFFSFTSAFVIDNFGGNKPIPVNSYPGILAVAVTVYVNMLLVYPLATFVGSFRPLKLKKGEEKGFTQLILGSVWMLFLLALGVYLYDPGSGLFRQHLNQGFITAGFLGSIAYTLTMTLTVGAFIVVFLNSTDDRTIPSVNYAMRVQLQKQAGKLLGIILTLLVLSVIPVIHTSLGDSGLVNRTSVGGASSVVGLLGAVYQLYKGREKSVLNTLCSGTRLIITAGLLIFTILLSAYSVAMMSEPTLSEYGVYFLVLILCLGLFVNLNYFGIARMYRDRLMETFMPDMQTIKRSEWAKAREADSRPISEFSDVAPYHLINTNIVLVDSEIDYFRGRGGDSFIISPQISGSKATGYVRTSNWLNNRMNLPTAVAISGAALNPNTGVGGRGVTRNRLVSFLLSLLQARIGYWAPNVRFNESTWSNGSKAHRTKFYLTQLLRPNYWIPGLMQGLFGRGLHANASWIELTDGGHFDNTGVYELIRRELDLIVVSIASADPEYKHEDLANIIRKARVDFGARIIIDADELDSVIPDKETGVAEKGYMKGKIKYANGKKEGDIVIIVATFMKNLTLEILSYKKDNPDFPHESTTDQFYNERQLEAYRELGCKIAEDLMKDNSDYFD